MVQVTPALVKELRQRSGAGILDCQKALKHTDGDLDLAFEELRKHGQAKAAKKAGRTAAEGVILILVSEDKKSAVMVEINCETDFVARDSHGQFRAFADKVVHCALTAPIETTSDLLQHPFEAGSDQTIDQARQALVAIIGENIQISRFKKMHAQGDIHAYLHGQRIGVLVDITGADEALGKSIAMHVAASQPVVVNSKDLPQELLDKEKEIFLAQLKDMNKPESMIENIIQGKLKKFMKEISLLDQPYVKDPNQSVATVLKQAGATPHAFVRFHLGEFAEKQSDSAADVISDATRG